MTTFGSTLFLAAVVCTGAASAGEAARKADVEYRTVVPVTPLPQPNAATPPPPEARPKTPAKTTGASKSHGGGKVSVGRGRTGNGRLHIRSGFQLDADGGFDVHDDAYAKLEPGKTADAQPSAPAPVLPSALPSGTTVNAVPDSLAVRTPKVETTGPRREEVLFYRVRTGDTLEGIARRLRASGLDVTSADLLRANNDRLPNASAIRPGDELRVPLKRAARHADSMPMK
jgi:nucleoid-associated protein YgaU